MKRYILITLLLLIIPQIKAQISIDRDSLVIDLTKDKFIQKEDSNGLLYQFVPEVNGLLPKDETLRKNKPQLKSVSANPYSTPMSLSNIPSSVDIDKTKAVGEMPIQSKVEGGSLTYNVPIDIYKGKNEHQPEISLSYNSMMGNSIAGYGWSIGGLSNISITNSNYYYDGTNAKPASMDKNSAFALDGNRLIKISETSSQVNYQTEHGNIKVVFYAPSGKYYFDVYYPDGKKATFGYSTNTSAKINYPITNNVDAHGGFINFTYSLTNNVYYITEIKYGSNTTQFGTIKFTYQTRDDIKSSYIAGQLMKEDKLLSKIDTYYQTSALLSTYILTYETKTYTFLSKITLNANSKDLNPLTFYYGSDDYGGYFQTDMAFLEYYFANSKAPDLVLQKGKFNYLTSSEGLVAYPNFETYGITGYDSKGNCLYGSKYSPTQNLLIYKNLGDYFCSPVKLQAGDGFQKLFPADYNGDGDDELVRVNYWFQDDHGRVDLTTYDKNMSATNFYFLLEGAFAEGSRRSPVPRTFLTGDFRGTGKTDLVAVSSYVLPKNVTRPNSRTTLIDLSARTKIYDQVPFKYDYFKDALFSVDYDGDGKTDICLINGSGVYIYSYQNGVFEQIAYTNAIRNIEISGSSKKELLIGDINGDGLMDFLLSPQKNDYWIERVEYPCGVCEGCRSGGGLYPIQRTLTQIAQGGLNETAQENHNHEYTNHLELLKDTISTSSLAISPFRPIEPIGICQNPIFENIKHYYNTYKTWTVLLSTGKGFTSSTFEFLSNSDTNYQFLFHDINGDKLPDLAVKSGSQVGVYLNLNGVLNTVAETAKVSVDYDSHFITGTVGDGYSYSTRTSQLLSIKDAVVTPISYTRNDARERMLTGMVNSYGVIERINYSNLTNGSVYWTTSTYNASYPYNKLFMDINVVSNTYAVYNNRYISSKSYYYNDAVTHRQGLGFMGFQKITTYNNNNNTKIEQFFDPSKFGVMTQVVSPTVESNYYYTSSIATNKIAKITMYSKVEKDKLKNTSVSSSYTYDTYGNVTKEIATYNDGIKVITDNSYSNTDNATTYRLGFLYDQITTKSRSGNTWVDRKYIPVYSNYLPIVKVQSLNGNSVSEVINTYDGGLVTQESLKEYSSTDRLITQYEYDTYGRVIKKTNPSGLIENYTYNAKGQLASVKNHKGHETKFEYDDFGRKVKTTKPDGTIESIAYTWASEPTSALTLTTKTETGSPSSQSYNDAFGREVRSGKQRFDRSYIYIDNEYDDKGRLAKVSMPFKGTSPSQWSTYTYDSNERITSLKYASGKEDSFSYSNTTITSVVDGITKKETYSALGDVTTINDPGGNIIFNYRADGQLSNVISAGNTQTSFEYDSYGRQVAINDPSFGTVRYTYDAAGNINQETDANGNITKKTYDKFHRLVKKEVAGLTIDYTYNPDCLIASEASSNGTSKTYTYDALLRLSTEKEVNVDGKWFQKVITYANGNTSALAYSSNTGSIVTENYTYAYGHLSEIKLNNATSVWKLTSEDAMGSPTGVNTGVLTRTFTYDANGRPTARTVKNGSTVIQNFGYSFDSKTDNLTWRKDSVRNIKENFSYDNLNRLAGFAGKTVSYSNNGNITSISNVGDFSYENSRPHAIASVTPYGTEVPLRSQQITCNALRRPNTISENNFVASFTYNGEGEKVKMNIKKSNVDQVNKYYWGNQYEFETGIAGTKEILYLGGDAYSAAAVYVKEGSGSWAVYYLCRDYLGSITHIVDSSGGIKQELSYDPWGRLRNPVNQALYAVDTEPSLFLGRGYTGHEHLIAFGLINMNARLYDPVIGRFLSPDPQLQNPYFTQNYNRYSYCLNNPLKYNDPNGEFIFGIFNFVKDLFVNTFIKSWSQGFNAWSNKDNWRSTINAFKLDIGLFKGGFWNVVSRLTWQLPQTLLGYTLNQTLNNIYLINDVNYFDGAVVIDSKIKTGGLTLSNYILGPPGFKPDFRDHLFVHEYGHYLQSRKLGPAYLFVVAKPSLLSATFDGKNHDYRWYETHASKLAANYFDKKYGSGTSAYQDQLQQFNDGVEGVINPATDARYFDRNSFITGERPSYLHPRNRAWDAHPIKHKWRKWSDFFFY